MKQSSYRSVITAMYAAIICVSCFITIPIASIPIVIQNMLVIMSGALFGFPQGVASVGLFMTVGALGFPVFAGGKGGMAVLSGPTGGFIIGYFVGALICAYIAKKPQIDEPIFEKKKILKLIFASFAGFMAIYIIGVVHFMRVTSISLPVAISTCIIPFLPGDLIKLVAAVVLSAKLRPLVAKFMYDD